MWLAANRRWRCVAYADLFLIIPTIAVRIAPPAPLAMRLVIMTIYPYLPKATVATTSARSYMELLTGEAA